MWTFDPVTKKMRSFDCALGKITRYIICVDIDEHDVFAYCGTRSGDVLEVSLGKGIFNRSGPINKKFKGAVNQVVVKDKQVFIGNQDATFAKIDKGTLNVSDAGTIKFPYNALVSCLAASKSKVYCLTTRGDMKAVADGDTMKDTMDFMSSPFDMVSDLKFHANFCGVFSSCS